MGTSAEQAMTTVTGSRIAQYGGRGFIGAFKNMTGGLAARVKENGLWATACWVGKHKEASYLNASSQKVGEDEFGNKYYEDTSNGKMRGRDRWVVYDGPGNGSVYDWPQQASAVPPTWHGWLHQTDDRPPPSAETLDPCTDNFIVAGSGGSHSYDHVKPWRENPTGTGHWGAEYRQPGHWAAGNHKVQTYNSWTGDVKQTLPPTNSHN